MLKVAIVEDELFMREFLEHCINYEELGFSICGSFCCAEDALLGLSEKTPDLVITDIKMSGMDGITFMSEMLKINQDTHFVVISNFQDFETVRSAFRLGICDYIPKIDFELEHYKETLLAFAKTRGEAGAEPQQEKIKNLKAQFWSDDFSTAGSEAKAVNEQTMIFALVEILNYENVVQSQWKMDKELLKLGLSNFLEEKLAEFGNCDFFFNEYDKLVLLFATDDLENIKNLIYEICDFLHNYFQFELCVFFEENHTKLKNLKDKYAELYNLKKFRFFLPENTFITKAVAEKFEDTFDCVLAYGEMEKLFLNNEFDTIIKKLTEIKNIKPSAEYVEEVLYFYQNMLLLVSGIKKRHKINSEDSIPINEMLSVYNYEKVMEKLISDTEKISEQSLFPDKKLNRAIDEYILKHYAEKISLEEMAKEFQYEYSYFSKIFRNIKGIPFKKHLNNFRLEKAESLIRNTSLKYSEIAVKVGYQSYEHFSRCFREKYGMWPNELERVDENA
ncbi:MAG: response regulator [Clostridia bacterium]|nr:response regulator [Clostridia bacterium]